MKICCTTLKSQGLKYNIYSLRWIVYAFSEQMFLTSPSKNETSTQCCTNVGPPSTTLAQHWLNIGWMSRVCWATSMSEVRMLDMLAEAGKTISQRHILSFIVE